MNKNDFEIELKELMTSMSEKEIEKTIMALSKCKSSVYKRNNREKAEKSRLFSTVERNESKLRYLGKEKKEGYIKALGASVLSNKDFDKLKGKITHVNENWWLYDGYCHCRIRIKEKMKSLTFDRMALGSIRPIILIEEIKGDIQPGEEFYINDEVFHLLTPSIAIKSVCLDGLCTYSDEEYESSILRFCVDGWYMKLVRDNAKNEEPSGHN